ncbi:hypothetical protein [Candidatus Protochlamydia phocaeensis]|uniref:hypothetical protein n=1 Tax=Candidatus Protochlamydia phocaeensis TaxID=1414722 RepID=UPI0008398BB5|nr:hypothetical protein [Candidatus Protochlamydia phocaeensis]
MYISQRAWMIHPQHIFSLPPSIQVSREQLCTIDRQTYAVAQTRLAFFSETWLKVGINICKGIGIIAAAVTAVTGYFGLLFIRAGAMPVFYKMLPPFFLGSLTVVVCLMGKQVIRWEQKERFKRECLEFEHQLIEWRDPCVAFKDALKNFQHNKSVENLLVLEQKGEVLKEKLTELDSRLVHMTERLKEHYNMLFGSTRTFNNGGTWTDYWTHCFRNELALNLSEGRSSTEKIPEALERMRQHGSLQDLALPSTETLSKRQQENIIHANYILERLYKKFLPNSPNLASPDEWLERARASLAAFRSTLDH